ncbi:SIMPL domain-containing protein [Micromonosporaceae bacterium Da 78-11]
MTDQPMIVVRGEALREVPPEQAVLSVTVSVRDRDRQAVLTRLTERSAGLRVLLDGYGVVERRETSGAQIYPELKPGSEKVVAYNGSVGTTVTVTDFGELGELFLSLAALDQVSISGPWWQLKPGSRAGAEVRKEAIGDALARAREYAAAVGATVDRLVEIADEGAGGGGGHPMMMRAAYKDAGDAPSLELDPQPQTVQASVIVRVTITEPDLTS